MTSDFDNEWPTDADMDVNNQTNGAEMYRVTLYG